VPGLQIFRSFLSLLGFWAFIYAFGQLPLLDATALTYTQALFMTGFAALLLGESVRSPRWVASLIGLCGAMFVIRPAFTAWDAAYLVALAAPFFNAAALTATKFLEQRDSSLTIMAWLTAIYLLCSSPALLDWQELPASLWFWVITVMILGPLGTYLRILAIRAADMSVLAPYDYVRLVINGCFALVLFHEIPDPLSVVGAAMIVAGCVLVVLPARWIPILVGRTVVRLRSG
jgi:drug/metabolite transporter (DMT)-like permease